MGVASPILVTMVTYNERVEIGGDTIQFYHKLEQPFTSYCNKHIGILYTSQWVVYNFCTPNGLPIHFQWWVADIQILITSHYQLQII